MVNLINSTSPPVVAVQSATLPAVKAAQPVQPALSSTTPEPEKIAAVTAAAMELQARAQKVSPSLEFKVDDATRRTVVTVRDTKTGDVIRQIPSEEALHLAQQLTAIPSAILSKEA